MQNQFKVCFHPNMDSDPIQAFEKEFPTKREAIAAREAIADYTLFLQDKTDLMTDHSNTAYIEEYIKGEWVEADENDYDSEFWIDGKMHEHNGNFVHVIMSHSVDGNYCDVYGEFVENCQSAADFTVKALNNA